MSSRYGQARAKLADCQHHGAGSGAELFLVEGDSAQASVAAVRDERTQAVLPLQGKPLNAWQASVAKVQAQALFGQIAQALGLASPTHAEPAELAALRFERVLLLFDPDADGIHIGALVLLYFQRWLPQLLDSGHVWLVRAPMFELVAADGTVHHAYQPNQCQAMTKALAEDHSHAPDNPGAGPRPVQVQAYRGLGSIGPSVLRTLCVDPATRQAHAVDAAHMRAVIEVFGGGLRSRP